MPIESSYGSDVCPTGAVFRVFAVVASVHPPCLAAHIPSEGTKWQQESSSGFSDDKGFGFITPDDSGKDLFVHHSAIQGNGFRPLAEGPKVSYNAEQGPKGPAAANVQAL